MNIRLLRGDRIGLGESNAIKIIAIGPVVVIARCIAYCDSSSNRESEAISYFHYLLGSLPY